MTCPGAECACLRCRKRRWMAAARARQRALDPTRNWREEEYAITKFKRATRDPPAATVEWTVARR